MKRSLGVLAAAAWLALALYSILGREEATRWSAAWSIDASFGVVPVLWAVTLGLASADSVRLVRLPEIKLLLRVLPRTGQLTLIAGRTFWLALWTNLGMLASVLVAIIISAIHGSIPQPSQFTPLLFMITGNTTIVIAGQLVGLIAPSLFLPPLLGAGAFGLWGLNVGGVQNLLLFVSGSNSGSVVLELRQEILFLYTGLYLLLAVCALTALSCRVLQLHWGVVASTILFAALSAGGIALTSAANEKGAFETISAQQWSCVALSGEGSLDNQTPRLCVPHDQKRDQLRLAEALRPIDLRLRQIAPDHPRVEYTPSLDLAENQSQIELPFGAHPIDEDSLGSQIAQNLSGCHAPQEGDPVTSIDKEIALSQSYDTAARWIYPNYVTPDGVIFMGVTPLQQPTSPDAIEALRALEKC